MLTINNKNLCESCFAEINSDLCPECGFSKMAYSPDPAVLKCGTILQNRYIIGKVIGKGGFGITYRAYDAKLEILLAVKEYYPYGLAARAPGQEFLTVSEKKDEDIFKLGAEKFYGEARLVAKFNGNPNIVAVNDFFYENDTAYYVMEYLDGQTLSGHVAENGGISVPQAVFIASEISNALMAAHSSNILHRDISPDNIMLCNDGGVKLLDFGAARQVMSEKSSDLSVILKQGFAPLEQYQRKGKQGPWTDIYSLGATLYYALTGNLPDDPMSRMDDDNIEENRFGIDSEFWNILEKALKIRFKDRYQNIFEFKNDLNAISVKSEPIITPKPIKIPVGRTAKVYGSTAEMPLTVPASQEETSSHDMPLTVPASREKISSHDMPLTVPASREKISSPDMPPTVPVSQEKAMSHDMPLTVPASQETAPSPEMPLTVPISRENSLTTDLPDISPYGNEKKKKNPAMKYVIPAVLITVVICIVGFNIFKDDTDISQQIISESYENETEETSVTTTVTETETASAVTEEQAREADGLTPPQAEETSVNEQSPPEGTRTAPSQTKPDVTEPSKPSETSQAPPSQTKPAATEPPKQAETSQTPPSQTKPAVTEPPKPATTTAAPAQTKPAQEKIPATVKIGNETYDTSIKVLDLTNKKLENSDIVNLKYMTKLTELNLSRNNISDISPLANLTNLKKLIVNYNSITDISPLENLTNIEWLALYDNNISDISALSNHTKITELTLSENNISDFSPLSKCKFKTLRIAYNPLNGDLKAFKGLNFTGYSALFDIQGCGYDKYVTDDIPSQKFDDAIHDSIKFDNELSVYIFSVTKYVKYKNKK